jgi:tripartite-type tricarboxylate transporter receptor subunit TctC
MYPKLDYDIEKDFIPLALVASVPQVVVVNPKNVPRPTSRSSWSFVKKNPAKLNYGSAGAGHLAPPGGRAVQAADQNLHHAHPLPRRRPGAART